MATHPSYTPDERREYMRRYRAEGRDRTRVANRNVNLPFVGVDGEGGNVGSGYHAYFLLRSGGQSIVPTGSNVRLSTRECLDFLSSLDPDAIYVVYYGDYDVTKILEDLGWSKLDKLINRGKRVRKDGRGIWPVDYAEFQVEYLPRKEFKVRREISRTRDVSSGKWHIEYSPWIVVNDVGSFFQCKFVEALEKWNIGTPNERMAIARDKERRDSFVLSDLPAIAEYNALECRLLAQLMEKFRSACIKAGYVPSKWQGPGQLAEAMFRKHGLPQSKDIPLLHSDKHVGLLEFARNAFYGGRPETMAIGYVNRSVDQWDLNGAYPYAMQGLPCLIHGLWHYSEDADEILAHPGLGIWYGSFYRQHSNKGRYPMWYGLPIRNKDGTILYPGSGRGWYWSFEIRASIHQRYVPEQAWLYTRKCQCTPMAFLEDVYRERQRIGKDDAGIVLKLASNSAYGKQVQSIGVPKFSNPIWGSFITASCRMQIQDFIHSSPLCRDPDGWCGKDILMVATDSVCTWQDRTDVVESTELGGWSRERHPNGLFIVQPGLYFGSSGKRAKTRGVPYSVISDYEPRFRAAFAKMCETHLLIDGDVQVPQRMFVGIRYALHRKNLKLLGQWIEFEDPETGRTGKTIRFDWGSKRALYPAIEPIPGVRMYIETLPQEGDPDVETIPYHKDIGGLLIRSHLREMFEAQPDWASGPLMEGVIE